MKKNLNVLDKQQLLQNNQNHIMEKQNSSLLIKNIAFTKTERYFKYFPN